MSRGARGSSLVEALAALVVLAIVLAGVFPGLLTFADANKRNELRTGAVQAAQISLESLRIADIASLPSGGSSPPQLVDVGDYEYEVVTVYCRRASLCNQGSRHLVVEVLYGGEELYSVETVFTDFRF